MKYIKLFENRTSFYVKKYSGKVYIDAPSTKYFKSDVLLRVILVDNVLYNNDTYVVNADYLINCMRSGEIYYDKWEQTYHQEQFNLINFMTVAEFYNNHTDLYMRIMQDLLNELEEKYSTGYKNKLQNTLDRLIIPETEYIVQAKIYNL